MPQSDDADLADAWGSALDEMWNAVEAEECYGVRILLADMDNDDHLAAVIAPRVFSHRMNAEAALLQLSSGQSGEDLIKVLVNTGWLVLPEGARRWDPIAFRVVRLAEVPF